MKFLLHLLLLTMLSALSGAAWVAQRPVESLHEATGAGGRGADLGEKIRQATIKRTAVLEVSEATLNDFLAARLSGSVREGLAQWITFEGLQADLSDGVARFDLRWMVAGQVRSASVEVTVKREGDVFRVHVPGGAYGHLRVIRGLLRPLVPTFRQLEEVFEEEIAALFQMNEVEIREGKLVLDPRF